MFVTAVCMISLGAVSKPLIYTLIGGNCVMFAMAKSRMIPKSFAKMHSVYKTPIVALLLLGLTSYSDLCLNLQNYIRIINNIYNDGN